MCLYCLDENKILIAYIIDFWIVYLINVLVFKVITLNRCCPLEPNELSAHVESSSCLDSRQWSHMLKSLGSTEVEQIPGLQFSRCLANTHVIYKEKMAISCAWLISTTQKIGNIQLHIMLNLELDVLYMNSENSYAAQTR